MAFSVVKFTGGVVRANNWKDKKFDFCYRGNGSDASSKARNKVDNSKSYVRLDKKSKYNLYVNARAKKGLKDGDYGDTFSGIDTSGVYLLKPGHYQYFNNSAHKKGYKATYLIMWPELCVNNVWFYGVWSPDNCSGR